MNNEDYASYELAKKLKACGFDEPCRCCYVVNKDTESDIEFTEYTSRSEWNSAKVGGLKYPYKHISAPTLAHAQKWLREKKGIAINVIAHDGGAYDYDIVFLPNAVDCDYPIDRATFSRTYEEALSEGIAAALELIE